MISHITNETPRPNREQVMASIEELTPGEKELAIAIEKRLATLSNWKLRDAVIGWHQDAYSMSLEMEKSMDNQQWLHLAWEIIDVIKEARKLQHALLSAGIDIDEDLTSDAT